MAKELRQVDIDCNSVSKWPYPAGNINEHNATELRIIPPKTLRDNAEHYRVRFSVEGEKKPVLSRTLYLLKGQKYLNVRLWRRITQQEELEATLVGYRKAGQGETEDDTYIGMSDLIKLSFGPSVGGWTPPEPGDDSMETEVADNTAARHTHENKPVLDALGDEDGELTYNGVGLGGGAGGTSNYNTLSNKPQINDVTLQGNKALDEIGIQEISNLQILELFYGR